MILYYSTHTKQRRAEYSIAIANANLGTIFCIRTDYKKALELYMESELFFEAHNYTKNLAVTDVNISGIYYILGNFDKAYTYICKSIDLYKGLGATYWEAKIYNTYAFFQITDPTKIHNLDEIMLSLEKNACLFNNIGDNRSELTTYSKIGLLCRIKNDQRLYNNYYEKMKEILDELIKKEFNLMDELQLCEVYINLYSFEKAEKIITELLTKVDDGHFYKPIILVYNLVVSFLIGKDAHAFSIIEELTQKESIFNKKCEWDFIGIMPTLKEKLKNPEYILISDLMSFVQNKTKFPLIRLQYVTIIKEEPGSQAEIFHPFVGYKKITKEDTFYKNILGLLIKGGKTIDADCSEIMEEERNSALMTLGYLYKKGYIMTSELSTNILKIELTSSALNKLTTHKTKIRV